MLSLRVCLIAVPLRECVARSVWAALRRGRILGSLRSGGEEGGRVVVPPSFTSSGTFNQDSWKLVILFNLKSPKCSTGLTLERLLNFAFVSLRCIVKTCGLMQPPIVLLYQC